MSIRQHLAPTPPLGWNSYDSYGGSITEAELRANIDSLAVELLPAGYQYACIDALWVYESVEPTALAGVAIGNTRPFMDAYGRCVPAPTRFPSAAGGAGFKPMADHAHRLGLKFGIHIMRGIPRAAVAENLPIWNSKYRTRDVADPTSRCGWEQTMWGVDLARPGAQDWYDSLIALYADWEVDFIKADDMGSPYYPAEIAALYQAIARCPRPIRLSLSPGVDLNDILRAHTHVSEHSEMWRISADIWDKWTDVRYLFSLCGAWAAAAGPGSWPDADMLPYGMLGLGNNPSKPTRPSRLTPDEMRTHFTLLSIARSPLLFGGDVTQLDPATKAILTNLEVLAVNQQSVRNRQLNIWGRTDRTVAWSAVDAVNGDVYLALFNLEDTPAEVAATLVELGFTGSVNVRDLWTHKNLEMAQERIAVRLAPHACVLYRLSSAGVTK